MTGAVGVVLCGGAASPEVAWAPGACFLPPAVLGSLTCALPLARGGAAAYNTHADGWQLLAAWWCACLGADCCQSCRVVPKQLYALPAQHRGSTYFWPRGVAPASSLVCHVPVHVASRAAVLRAT